MKNIKRKMLAVFMACMLMFSLSSVAFAAEAAETAETSNTGVLTFVSEDGTVYKSAFVFDEYGDRTGGIYNQSCNIPAGSYTLYYSVTTTCNLTFNWSNNYWSSDISGSGSKSVYIAKKATSWSLVPYNTSVYYSYSFMM